MDKMRGRQGKVLDSMCRLLLSPLLACLATLLLVLPASAITELSTRAEFPASQFTSWGCVDTGEGAASTHCSVVGPEGDLEGGGLATAGYGSLGARAGASSTGAVRTFQARSTASFRDTIQIVAPGRGLAVAYVRLTLSVDGDFEGTGPGWAAGGSASLSLGSEGVSALGFSDASADAFFSTHESETIAGLLNTRINFSGGLSVFANVRGTSSATAAMDHTARVAGFRVYEDRAGLRPFSQNDYTLRADSGTLYPVPEPGTALLMGLGLTGLAIGKPRASRA